MNDFPAPDFPVLDAGRESADGRVVLDEFGFIEAFIGEIDDWASLPVRVTIADGVGLTFEVGPYDLNISDVSLLRRALDGYDRIRSTEGKLR
ncbi:hypothetical protein [Mycobacterium sp.]|uniref:hypothetical protein n=1 Tax=Mycobacterium sp. TaxID=1785 RepID=UPI0031D66400